MRPPHSTLTSTEVQQLFQALIEPVLGSWPAVRRCTRAVVVAVLAFAAQRLSSIHDACARLDRAPDGDTVLGHLARLLLDPARLERRLQAALTRDLPRAVRRGGWPVAVDITLIPYHGAPHRDPSEVYRGQPKSGTTHFHAYATAYLVRAGHRYTLAVIWVRHGTTGAHVVRDLLRRVRAAGVRVRVVLVDRGFNNAGVVRYLQAARVPFIMPQAVHGRAPADGQLRGLRAIRAHHPTGWTTYRWKPHGDPRHVQVALCVCRRRRRDRRGHRVFLYACGRIHASPAWVKAIYRQRFGVETSYRQMNRCRIRTTTRKPALRLLFVGVALLLRNLWAWLHWNRLAQPRRGGRRLQLERLRLATMLLWLAHLAEALLGYHDAAEPQPPPTS
jgi:putative transposase